MTYQKYKCYQTLNLWCFAREQQMHVDNALKEQECRSEFFSFKLPGNCIPDRMTLICGKTKRFSLYTEGGRNITVGTESDGTVFVSVIDRNRERATEWL